MRRVIYSPLARRLVYLDAKATPEFWDEHWQAEGKPHEVSPRNEVIAVTQKYLPRGSRVLEGGCGRANKVHALAVAGFEATGVDFAEDCVREASIHYPGLDIRQGDVRKLEFTNGYFDGYWSLGVIEHFWSGYDAILAEAARVLRPQGFLFLTAPWFSPYRRRKARLGGYPYTDFQDEPDDFYQFALSRDEVSVRLERHGFQLLSWKGVEPEVSMNEDMTHLKRQVAWLLDSRHSIAKRALRRVLSKLLGSYCGHSFLAVARRNGMPSADAQSAGSAGGTRA